MSRFLSPGGRPHEGPDHEAPDHPEVFHPPAPEVVDPRDIPRHWGAVALLGGAMVAAALGALKAPRLQRADVVIHDLVALRGRPPLDTLVVYTTDLGSVYAVIGAATTLALRGRVRTGLDVAAVGSVAWIIAQNAKRRVRRQRPYEAHGVRRLIGAPTGSSFPSGHACVATAFATVLANRSRVRGARRAFYGIASWVAASRVYVGVHYPTDVIGGAGLGLSLGALWRGPLATAARRWTRRDQRAVLMAVDEAAEGEAATLAG